MPGPPACGARRAGRVNEPARAGREQLLGAQLPGEIARYMKVAPPGTDGERFSSDEFLARVSEREGVDLPVSVHHARVVLEVLREAVSAGEVRDVLERLPDDYRRLFVGSQGRMRSR